MANMKTRFLDINDKVPVAAQVRNKEEDEEQKKQDELSRLYYEQWVDNEMWKKFSINEEQALPV